MNAKSSNTLSKYFHISNIFQLILYFCQSLQLGQLHTKFLERGSEFVAKLMLRNLNLPFLFLHLIAFQSSPVERRMEAGKKQELTILFPQLAPNTSMERDSTPLECATGKGHSGLFASYRNKRCNCCRSRLCTLDKSWYFQTSFISLVGTSVLNKTNSPNCNLLLPRYFCWS